MPVFLNNIDCSYQWDNLLLNYLICKCIENLSTHVEQMALEEKWEINGLNY